jgi:hypothetical protein
LTERINIVSPKATMVMQHAQAKVTCIYTTQCCSKGMYIDTNKHTKLTEQGVQGIRERGMPGEQIDKLCNQPAKPYQQCQQTNHPNQANQTNIIICSPNMDVTSFSHLPSPSCTNCLHRTCLPGHLLLELLPTHPPLPEQCQCYYVLPTC